MNNSTCGYCGSGLGETPIMKMNKCFCSFCEMYVDPMKDGERVDRLQKVEFVGYEHMQLNTPYLMGLHTKTLLHLLRFMRKERRSYFDNMRILKIAANKDIEFKDGVTMSSDEYEMITRKCFVVENILKGRLGYIPKKITDNLLISYEERCSDENNIKIMNIRKPVQEKGITR